MRAIPALGSNASHPLSYAVPWSDYEEIRPRFLGAVTRIPVPSVYDHAYRRWTSLQQSRSLLTVEATLGGPLAVGLGDSSPLEVGLTLHKIYGVPMIPGSAIKGTCLRAIAMLPDAQRSTAKHLFGSQDSAGYAVFHDAWLVPQSMPLQLDVITVHHPSYYQLSNAWPTDFDDPVPVAFLSVPAGGRFFFAVEVPGASEAWKTFVEHMLHSALTELGIGAKTQAGDGWYNLWLAPPGGLGERRD
jgi:CRISPR-associated protein Cmr6